MKQHMKEDLRKWFRQKWVNLAKKNPGGGYEPCGTSGDKKAYAKCVPAAKASGMSKSEIKSAVRRKRAAQAAAGRPGKDQPGQGNTPIMVKTMKETTLQEKNTPTNPELWSKAKTKARSKFDVYPSAYANAWAANWYKKQGGGWKSVNESQGPCWDGYQQEGMKKKGNKMVPNCVPVSEQDQKKITFKEFVDVEMCDTLDQYMDNTIDLSDPSNEEMEQELENFYDDLTDEEWEEILQDYEMDEDVHESGLTPMGRIKKRFAAIRSRQKRKLYKNISLNRPATPARLQRRAKQAARRMMYKKILRGRPRTSLSPSEKSRVETMMKRVPFQAFITRQTIRLRPNLRKVEMKRIVNRRMRK